MKRVLVTGANGFIGRQCLPLLLAKGYEVHAVSRQDVGQSSPGVVWHNCNLLESASRGHLVTQVKPEYLLHLAWYAVPGKFWESPENTEWVRASLDLFRRPVLVPSMLATRVSATRKKLRYCLRLCMGVRSTRWKESFIPPASGTDSVTRGDVSSTCTVRMKTPRD